MQSQSTFHSKYTIGNKIGQGSFGAVYECKHNETQQLGALKRMDVPQSITSLKRLLREVLLLKYLRYEHLICLKDCYLCYDKRGTYILFVTELMHMNLRNLISLSNQTMTGDRVKFFLYQIFLALAYLHLNDIVHRDIKPDNILVNKDNIIKVGDFGWARQIISSKDLTKVIANIHYRAPEVCLRNQVHDSKVDIWAVGCLFFEMVQGNILFIQKTDLPLMTAIFEKFGSLSAEEVSFVERKDARAWILKHNYSKKTRPSQYLSNFSDPNGKDLFDQCLQINPNHRIGAVQALNHPYFEDIFDPEEVAQGMINHANQIDFSFENNQNLTKGQLIMRINQEIKGIKPWV